MVSAQLTAAKAAGKVWRVGFRPEPWAWSGWEWATDGRFPGRWDDLHGNFRTIYAGSSLLACLLEVLAHFRKDARLSVELDEIVEDDEDKVLGTHPVPVPQPFAELLSQHLRNRPNLRTAAGTESPWLFPGTRAGQHLHPNTIMLRLRGLGIELLGARNTALDEHLSATPPPLVADALGYSYQVAFLHADAAGEAWARYAGERT